MICNLVSHCPAPSALNLTKILRKRQEIDEPSLWENRQQNLVRPVTYQVDGFGGMFLESLNVCVTPHLCICYRFLDWIELCRSSCVDLISGPEWGFDLWACYCWKAAVCADCVAQVVKEKSSVCMMKAHRVSEWCNSWASGFQPCRDSMIGRGRQ